MIDVLLPKDYEPSKPYGTLLILHDVTQRPTDLLEIRGLAEFADERDLVVVAPGDTTMAYTWTLVGDVQNVIADLEVVQAELCIDPDRTFIIGHGNGGIGAEQISCRIDGVVAMVLSSLRHWASRTPCNEAAAVPTLFLSPLQDPAAPRAGGFDCLHNNQPVSLASEIEMMKKHHGCKGASRELETQAGVCETATCEVELRWCRFEGGRDWGAMPNRLATSWGPCSSRPGSFDHVAEISAFFAGVEADAR